MSADPAVYFVGAGPGDPELLTVRAQRLLHKADIVLYDALVSDAILDVISARARRLPVGKRAGMKCIAQSQINDLLVRLAQPGRTLVRLKGGDPAIFGRLSEETAALRQAGIAFAIVPGVTAASAAAAACEIPLTQRGHARRLQFVTAHAQSGDELHLDWHSLADSSATTVFYMARQAANVISERLIAHGRAASTPVLLMSDVSHDSEMRLRVPLSSLPNAVKDFPPETPLIILVGEVIEGAEIYRQRKAVPESAVFSTACV